MTAPIDSLTDSEVEAELRSTGGHVRYDRIGSGAVAKFYTATAFTGSEGQLATRGASRAAAARALLAAVRQYRA
jgi:hypothetical protein